MDKGSLLILSGMGLIMIGFLLVFIGMLLSAASGEGEVEGGGVIMIGPIPIIFGTSGRAAGLVTLLAIVLIVLWIIASLLSRRG